MLTRRKVVLLKVGLGLLQNSSRRKHSMRLLYRPVSAVQDSKRPTATVADSRKLPKLSRSQKLMTDLGLVHPASAPGTYHLLPVAVKALDKLARIVDYYMGKVGGQKIQMPTLTSSSLWKKTDRLAACQPELMNMKDRHGREFLLSPTHEESVCDLLNGHPLSHKQLPLKLYQITGKFRDEMKPRFGLIRGREFLMKDLYTFDKDEERSRETYEQVNKIYSSFFDYIGVNWVKARGSSGTIGGDLSHEFHLISDVGEDQVLVCGDCSETFNEELVSLEQEKVRVGQALTKPTSSPALATHSCPNCSSQKLSTSSAIEVGHAFLLGTKYTKALNTTFINSTGKPQWLEMGCYGLGISRLLAAAIEVLSTEEEIRWPLPLAPYLIGIIPPKAGSKEELIGMDVTRDLVAKLEEILPNDVLLDDRTEYTIGRRLKELRSLGIPYVIILGKGLTSTPGRIEVHDVGAGTAAEVGLEDVLHHCYELRSKCNLL